MTYDRQASGERDGAFPHTPADRRYIAGHIKGEAAAYHPARHFPKADTAFRDPFPSRFSGGGHFFSHVITVAWFRVFI
jgi:hypothetical protein